MSKNQGKQYVNTDYAIAMGLPIRAEELSNEKNRVSEKEMTKEALKEKQEDLARYFE